MRRNRPNQLADVIDLKTEQVEGVSIESAHLAFYDHLGRRCAVFASRAFPKADRPAPIVVHCPGGGQAVRPRDLTYLVAQGFAAVSFDWQIGAAAPDRASRWPDGVVSQKSHFEDMDQMVLPLAVQAAGVAIDWMASDARSRAVDVGVTGISWGGYLTWVINACEPRIKAAVPVYGCGGIFEREIEYMLQWDVPEDMQKQWQQAWDPTSLVDNQIAPVCYLSATNDFFGWHTLANTMLDQLPAARRRSVNPNSSHHLDVTDANTGIAFLRYHIDGGPAMPPEPMLDTNFLVDLRGGDAVDTTIWWTPSRGIDPHRCWLPGLPNDRNRIQQAFARVTYENGITLNSPLRQFDRRQADRSAVRLAARGMPVAAEWPDAIAGLGISPGFSTTQYWGQHCTLEYEQGDRRKVRFIPTDDPPVSFGFTFLGLADPAWNDGAVTGLSFDIEIGQPMPDTLQVVLRRGKRQSNCGVADVPLQRIADGLYRLTLRLDHFDNAPDDLTWQDVRLVMVTAGEPLGHPVLGPIRRLTD